MKKRTKILALLLAMTMCGTALAGCGSDKDSSEATNAVSTETTSKATESVATETTPAEPLKNVDIYPLQSDKTFQVATSVDLKLEDGSSIIWDMMEEATGVSIDWTTMTVEQLSLALSGKEIPDALFMFSGGITKEKAYEYGQAGFFVNFMDYLDIMPNFSAVIEEHPEYLDCAMNEDGSVYLLPQINVTNTGANNLIYYRTDMMKEIGWENPPATTNEFIQFCKDLQAHYGAIDSNFIAFNGYQASHMEWNGMRFPNYFFSAFGELVKTDLTVDSNDKVVMGAATEQYKHYLEFMNELWNSGAFNTNIYSQEAAASQGMAAANQVAIVSAHNGHSLDNFAGDEFEMDIMAPLTSEYWDTPQWYEAPSAKVGWTTAISTECDDIETMIKWMDAWYSTSDNPLNEEGTVFGISLWLGEIGVNNIMDDETMIYDANPDATIPSGKAFGSALYSGYEDGYFPYSKAPTSGVGVKGRGTTNNLWPYAVSPVDLTSLVLTQDELDAYNDAWADIDTYMDESTAKFITGEWSIEEKWDSYLDDLEKMGLSDVIKVYQAAYDRSK